MKAGWYSSPRHVPLSQAKSYFTSAGASLGSAMAPCEVGIMADESRLRGGPIPRLAGIWRRLKRAYRDVRELPYERRLGIRTALVTPALGHFAAQIGGHEGTPYRVLDRIAQHLMEHGIAPPRFIDVGCGLGRPLYYFADRFEELQGYEIVASLFAAAREQLGTVRAKRPAYARIDIHHADATTAVPLDRPMVLFLFNPFGPAPMARLCGQLKAAEHAVHLYYVNPVLAGMPEAEMGRPADARLRGRFDILYYRIAPAEAP